MTEKTVRKTEYDVLHNQKMFSVIETPQLSPKANSQDHRHRKGHKRHSHPGVSKQPIILTMRMARQREAILL
jgi:hypothetical protein